MRCVCLSETWLHPGESRPQAVCKPLPSFVRIYSSNSHLAHLVTRSFARARSRQWSLIGYVGLDPTSEESIAAVLMSLDMAVGWVGDETDVRGQYDEGTELNEADYDISC